MSDEPELQVGATGDWVAYLQRLLAEAGSWHGGETGSFDDALHASVLEYQTNAGLLADGVVRPELWSRLTSAADAGSWYDPSAPAETSGTPLQDWPSTDPTPAAMAIVLMTPRGVVEGAIANDEHVQFSAAVANPHQNAETGEFEVVWTLDGEEVYQTYPSLAAGMSDWVLYAVASVPEPGPHTVEVRWKPQGPYTNHGHGQLTFAVHAADEQPSGTGQNPSATTHQSGFGHTHYVVTEWGKLAYPSPARYPFAAALDQDTQQATRVFDRLNHAWQAASTITEALADADAFIARTAATFESEVGAHSTKNRQSAEEMETQRQVAAAVGTQIDMIARDMERAHSDLDAAELELDSVKQFEEARKLRDEAGAQKRRVGFASDALNLAAKTLSNMQDFAEKPLKLLEVAVQAFGNVLKISGEAYDPHAADKVHDDAVRNAMAAAWTRIESANRFIESSRHIAADATKNLTDAIEFYVQLQSEAEQGFDHDNPGTFRFAELARQQALIEQVARPAGDLRTTSDTAQAQASGLVETYEQIRRHLEDAGESDPPYVEALQTSSATAKLMALTANTMHKEATDLADRVGGLAAKLNEMHEKADYALSHHHPRAAGH